jgi:hypothetical protein
MLRMEVMGGYVLYLMVMKRTSDRARAFKRRRGVEKIEWRKVEINPGDNRIGNANAAIKVEQYRI